MLNSRIFTHRGLWNSANLPNSKISLGNAKSAGFSAEVDLRTFLGEICIAHDAKQLGGAAKLRDILDKEFSLALNIKEDGLLDCLSPLTDFFRTNGSFVFDGSIPQMYQYYKFGFPHALRLSEFERDLPWSSGIIWLDSFVEDWWIGNDEILSLFYDHRVIVVSPELHNRNPLKAWQKLRQLSKKQVGFEICTDIPQDFLEFINE